MVSPSMNGSDDSDGAAAGKIREGNISEYYSVDNAAASPIGEGAGDVAEQLDTNANGLPPASDNRPPPPKDPPPPPPPLDRPSKSCITCDAPGCDKKGPAKRCTQCKSVYYCDKFCAWKHWKAGHKQQCHEAPPAQQKQDGPYQCAICEDWFSQELISLDQCKHTYCMLCLSAYQEQAEQNLLLKYGPNRDNYDKVMSEESYDQDEDEEPPKPPSPCLCCRMETSPDMLESTAASTVYQLTRISRGKDVEEAVQLAESDLEDLNESYSNATSFSTKKQNEERALHVLNMRSEMCIANGRLEEACTYLDRNIDILRKGMDRRERVNSMAMELNEWRHPEKKIHLDPEGAKKQYYGLMSQIRQEIEDGMLAEVSYLIDSRLRRGRVLELQQRWKDAAKAYQSLLDDYPNEDESTIAQYHSMVLGQSRCAYQMGEYDTAIKAGLLGAEIHRSYPGGHEHLALAYEGKGDMASASEIAGKAYYYETPWDDVHTAKCYTTWARLRCIE